MQLYAAKISFLECLSSIYMLGKEKRKKKKNKRRKRKEITMTDYRRSFSCKFVRQANFI